MDTPKEFNILIRRKIPFISEGLLGIVAVLVLVLLLLYFFMLPAKNTSAEMAAGYYISVIPEWLQISSVIALVGLIVFMPLYFAARLNKPALLTLSNEELLLKGKKIDLTIPFSKIKRIYFNDLKRSLFRSKVKMQIVIQQKSGTMTSFFLANYDEIELALEALGKINNIEFSSYEDNLVTLHDDE